MPASREGLIAKLDDAYRVYFDADEVPSGIPDLAACYAFHSTNECFVISQKVKLWSAHTNEYVHVFSVGDLGMHQASDCIEAAKAIASEKIRPCRDHMESNITALFVCDSMQDDAAKLIRRARYHKNYRFSLWGWSDLRTAAVSLSDGNIVANRAGKDLVKFLRDNLNMC